MQTVFLPFVQCGVLLLTSILFIDEMELDIVCKIISAAIWYTLAEDVKMSPK